MLKPWATTAFLLGFVLVVAPVAGAQDAAAQLPADSLTAAAIDPSMRSPVVVPAVQLAAEIADDQKLATVKVGFPVMPAWTAEVGFTAAFDRDLPARIPASLRRLTAGSSFWGATTWTRAGASRRVAPFLSGRVETGRDAFDYYDMTLARHTDTHASYAMTATAGLVIPRDIVVAASYRWSEAWQVAEEAEPCHVSAETGTTYCSADRLFRKPAPQRWQQFEAQAQAHFGDRLGAEVFVTRDGREGAWGVEVPVYFMARRDGGFTGGLVMTYNGASDRFDVSAFVGQVFRLFK